jgi:hypothetical protein
MMVVKTLFSGSMFAVFHMGRSFLSKIVPVKPVKWLRSAMVPVLALILLALFCTATALVQAAPPAPTTITVTSPNGGESWATGTDETITWTSDSYVGYVKIDLSGDGGKKWQTIIPFTLNDGSETWAVSGPKTTNKARIRVSFCAQLAIKDVSDADFTITVPSITVTSPNDGETWLATSEQTIEWTSTGYGGGGYVNIELSRDGGKKWATIIPATADDGSENWSVSGPPTVQARIRISLCADRAKVNSDVSDADFTITVPSITVTSPNGEENWASGTDETITWTSTLPGGGVTIDLSANSGKSWKTIIPVTANDGSVTWAVFGLKTTDKARIRISFCADWAKMGNDISDADFTLTAPPKP